MEGRFRARIDDPLLRTLYDYWCSLSRHGQLPARSDINPAAIPAEVLPYIMMADILRDPQRIRFRLVGTNMVDEWGQDFTGRFLDELMSGSYRAYLEGLYADVIDRCCAVYSESAFRWDVGRSIRTRRLFMPLACDGRAVDAVLVGQTFDRSRPADQPKKIIELLPGHVETVRIPETVGTSLAAGPSGRKSPK